MSDPRLLMAQVYKALYGAGELQEAFSNEIDNCAGPDDAIRICNKYLALAPK